MSEPAEHAGAETPAGAPDPSGDTDAALFRRMARGDSSPGEAHAAFAEFHRRHVAYLFAACERRYRGEAEEIAAETLRRVYESAGRFDHSALAGASADDARRFVRAWLGRITRWVAADHFASRKRLPAAVALASLPPLPGPERLADEDSELVAQVRGVIESLSAREQEIAWVVAHGWSEEHGRLRWSQDDLDSLAERFGLTRENIRQVRARLMRKLRARLEPLLTSKPPTGEPCPLTTLPNRNPT